jgi:carbamoyltransferase
VQRRRHAVAAGFVDRQIEIVTAIAGAAAHADAPAAARTASPSGSGGGTRSTPIGFGGGFFVSPRINTRLASSLGAPATPVTFSPVPESVGLALGAALALSASSAHAHAPLRSLGLGPAFGEDEIKETLENCRIDYVYEPDWPRLTARASQLLARGKVVAWFHGALDFGPRSLGGRSILCDPSNRYARHNINEYLLRRPLDSPLAVSVPAELAAASLDAPLASPFMLLRGQFREDGAGHFQAALDATRSCALHTADRTLAPELHDLLTTHAASTGVPGLIHCPLRTLDAPTAATPRDAVGSLFSSAIDAIVIARFLVMKDYWLLRTASV